MQAEHVDRLMGAAQQAGDDATAAALGEVRNYLAVLASGAGRGALLLAAAQVRRRLDATEDAAPAALREQLSAAPAGAIRLDAGADPSAAAGRARGRTLARELGRQAPAPAVQIEDDDATDPLLTEARAHAAELNRQRTGR